MNHKLRWIIILLCVSILGLSLACSSEGDGVYVITRTPGAYGEQSAGTQLPKMSPTPAETATPTPDLVGTQAAAQLNADIAKQTSVAAEMAAVEAQAAVTQRAQQTEEARKEAEFQETREAVKRTQAYFDTQGTQEAVEATREFDTQRTATAQAEMSVTQTAQAVISETAIAHAIQTAEAMPTRTVQALALREQEAQTDTKVKTSQSEKDSAAARHWGTVVLLFLLGGLLFVALVKITPEAWDALRLRLAAYRAGKADKPTHFVPTYQLADGRGGIRALLAPWTGIKSVTAYDPDLEATPGQHIDVVDGSSKLLPGGDPTTAALDKAVDMLTRPVEAGGPQVPKRVAKRLAQLPKYRIMPPSPRAPRGVLPPGAGDVLDAEWEEVK